MFTRLLNIFRRKKEAVPPAPTLRQIWRGFQQVLAGNNEGLALMGDLEEKLSGPEGLDSRYLRRLVDSLDHHLSAALSALQTMSGGRWPQLETARLRIREAIEKRLAERPPVPESPLLVRLEEAGEEIRGALGGKAGNLVWVKKSLGLPVPDGFVATLRAYKLFMDQEQAGEPGTFLARLGQELESLNLADPAAVARRSQELQAMVLAQPIPQELVQSLVAEARRLAALSAEGLVVRSSGALEDIEVTFAGQFESFLGVTPEEVPERWRQVIASQFGERALIYFKLQGLRLEEAAMAVLVQRLIMARASGVMFTNDLQTCDPDRIIISATWGLAPDLVGGKVSVDEYVVSKETGRLLEARHGRKEYRLVVRDGSLVRETVPPELVAAPVLGEDDFRRLASFARTLEGHSHTPHNVEWAKDADGRLYVVQSRQLRFTDTREHCLMVAQVRCGAEVLLENGRVGSPGVAAGPVFRLREGQPLSQIPPGAVLVAPWATPQLAPVLPRLAALVTEVGSPTGHLALVAREYGVPTLVDTGGASKILPEGEEVTVDAFNGKVYRGRAAELLRYQTDQASQAARSPFYERVLGVADLIIPLHLVDRRSPDFRPENCRTYHDILRFAHEKAIQVMFSLMDRVAQGQVPALRLLKLKTPLPLNLHLVDLGDGLATHETPVPPEDILSRPMRALWRGISHPGITWAGPVPVNVGGFLHVLGQSAIRPPEKFWDKTYALVGANYVNYACRLGYHFQSVDSYLGDVATDNYINFTFKGGAADEPRRIRRVRLIAQVLEHLGFDLEIHGDVIRGRFRKRPAGETEERLDLLGRLMAYVRQMDMLMADDSISETLAKRFLAGHYERPGQERREEAG